VRCSKKVGLPFSKVAMVYATRADGEVDASAAETIESLIGNAPRSLCARRSLHRLREAIMKKAETFAISLSQNRSYESRKARWALDEGVFSRCQQIECSPECTSPDGPREAVSAVNGICRRDGPERWSLPSRSPILESRPHGESEVPDGTFESQSGMDLRRSVREGR
jgi:hypothetical protein